MKQRHRKRRKPVREDIPRGWTLIGVDYGAELVAALKGDPDNKGAHAAYNDMKRLIRGELGEVFRTKIVPAPRLERATPMPDIDPMTGHPWAPPFHRRWVGLDEFKAMFEPAPRLAPEAERALAAGLPIGRDGLPADPEKFGVISIDSAVDPEPKSA